MGSKQSKTGWILVIAALGASSGCGLFKRGDASSATVNANASKMAKFLEPSPNLVRGSNAATLLRLQKLFPSAVGAASDFRSEDILNAAQFNPRYAAGLNRALTADGRPSSAVAQIGMRKWAALLCKEQAVSEKAGAIFSKEGVLMTGEAAPAKGDEWLALSTARNAWLSPYKLDSVQVQALLKAYRETKAATGDNEEISRQTVCMSALLAPEFWMGNASPTEPLRRLALEVGRTVPTMADFEAYLSGKLTLVKYLERIQTDPQFQPGYLASVKEWHSRWWGMRDFLDSYEYGTRPQDSSSFVDDTGFRLPAREARSSYSADSFTFNHMHPVAAYTRRNLSDGNPLMSTASTTYAAEYNGMDFQEECFAEAADGRPNVQAFDPRTTMLVFEHKHPTINGRWEVVGAQVLDGYLPQFEAIVRTYSPGYSAATQCKRQDVIYPENWLGSGNPHPLRRQVAGYPVYWECKGIVSRTGGGLKVVDLRDFRHDSIVANENPANKDVRPNKYFETYQASNLSSYATRDDLLVYNNALIGTVHETFGYQDRRIRRQSPTGWQNGVSEMKTWYTGSKAYSCNALARYWMTCAFRPANETYVWDQPSLLGSRWGAVNEYLHSSAFASIATSANAHILNQFRCASARTDRLPVSGDLAEFQKGIEARDEMYFPHGYNLGATYATDTLDSSSINSVLNMHPEHLATSYVGREIFKVGGGTPSSIDQVPRIEEHAEFKAINRLNQDINNEPLNLLNYIVSKDQPYSELFNGKYSFGREELELFYRGQGLVMPAYPPGYTPPPVDAVSRTSFKRIERSKFPALPGSWFQPNMDYSIYGSDSYPNSFNAYHPLGTATIRRQGFIPPLPAAGILSMPAFIGPVSQKMRTVASRFFTRLLCGEPNIFAPQAGQEALHRQFMSHPDNPAPSEHLKSNSACFGCHVNLDPLASALSKNFLAHVQNKSEPYDAEIKAMSGEFGVLGGNFRGGVLHQWIGARSLGEKGTGAFLGQPATGIEQVGAILAEADLMYSCTVNRTFQEVYGRQPAMNDVKVVRDAAQSFKKHRNFNRMLRELVTQPQFSDHN